MTVSRHLGLDLGGTNLKVAVLEWADDPDRATTLVTQETRPAYAGRGPDGVAAAMVETGLAAIEAHGPVATVGIGVPGLFDRESGVIRLFPNFPGPWTGYPLKDRLEAGLGRPVVFINDARAHTLAESRMGAGRGARTMALVAIGTGVGGGLIIDGKLHMGTGTAGELGHQTVVEDGPHVRLRQSRLHRAARPGQGADRRGRQGPGRGRRGGGDRRRPGMRRGDRPGGPLPRDRHRERRQRAGTRPRGGRRRHRGGCGRPHPRAAARLGADPRPDAAARPDRDRARGARPAGRGDRGGPGRGGGRLASASGLGVSPRGPRSAPGTRRASRRSSSRRTDRRRPP